MSTVTRGSATSSAARSRRPPTRVNDRIPLVGEMPHGGCKPSGYGKDMSILTVVTASALLGTGALASTGSAADDAEPLAVTGAYACVDTISASKQKFVRVVFETASDLPRRSDGAIRAGAKLGRTFTVRFFTRDGASVTKKLKLRAERKGDDTGKPLGC